MLGDDMDKPIGNQSLWIHIFLTTNTGAAFSSGASNPKLVRTLQFLISFATLIVIYFVSKNRLYLFCFSVLSIGGFFNFFDGVINGAVMDYFQFNKYSPVGSAIFNVPDMCVVGSTILFLLIFITTMIRQIALGPENKIDTQLPLNLFLDTTQKVCYLCLFQNNKVIKKEKITTNNNLTDLIVEHINRMLKNCNVKKESIKKIYLTVGPGSFTGTRVGVLIAKT
jgi:lipoprotein signal peptidase